MSMSATHQRKQDRISLRATPRQVEEIDKGAAVEGKNRTDFVLDAAVKESRFVRAERQTFILSKQERDEFLRLLDRDPVEKPRLRALFERGSVLDRE